MVSHRIARHWLEAQRLRSEPLRSNVLPFGATTTRNCDQCAPITREQGIQKHTDWTAAL